MGTVNIEYETKTIRAKGKGGVALMYKKSGLEGFSPEVLGLGNIGAKSKQIGVIAVIFDLSGFTNFCGQVDPHLSMPRFLSGFLNWLFKEIRSELELRRFEEEIALYSEVPFFAKFMGDGVLFLWNTKNMNDIMICNIITTLRDVCMKYDSDFVPKIKGHLSYFPTSLRCGVACGNVCSVGNGEDYVGPCINIASRLQKLSSLGFCISRRGIDFEEGMPRKNAKELVVKSVPIRGIGEEELVIIEKSEFENLSPKEKVLFKDV